ncbi:SGNH/GDSL hydrolase family protein [Salipiger manganoxidans]|uniref:SGNH/GDSL hydrolase family protein n=1 Tax=Salipiger marinus TaxID=555512 RepID=UPI001E4D34E3|nr:SGNH/GDSL hydrolase family protein [Salipiger manganoxidans]MCD1621026.1 SGNH/GDSL hydrolase family protein [Salipiger manganoxidans]
MPDNGVRTIDLTNLASAEDLLAHDGGTLGVLPVPALSTRLAASGALAEAIAGRASTEQADALAAEIDVMRTEYQEIGADLDTLEAEDLPVRVQMLEEGQVGGFVAAATWTGLLAITPSVDGTAGEVSDSDTGTHSDASGTGYDGATVDNAGRYSWNDSWGRWVRIGDTGLSGKLDRSTTNSTSAAIVMPDDSGRIGLQVTSDGAVQARDHVTNDGVSLSDLAGSAARRTLLAARARTGGLPRPDMDSPPTLTLTQTASAPAGTTLLQYDAQGYWRTEGGFASQYGVNPYLQFKCRSPLGNTVGWTSSTQGAGAIKIITRHSGDSIAVRVRGNGTDIRVLVGDAQGRAMQYVSVNPINVAGDGLPYVLAIDFATTAHRSIVIEGSGTLQFGGIYLASGQYLAPPSRANPLVCALGTSVTEEYFSWALWLSYVMGWDVYNTGVGACGILADASGARSTQIQRSNDFTVGDFVLGIDENGINDDNSGLYSAYDYATVKSEFGAAYRNFVEAWFAAHPNSPLIGWGPFWPHATPTRTLYAIRDAKQQVLSEYPLTAFIDTLTPSMIQGRRSDGTYPAADYIKPDNTHPNEDGQLFIGERLSAEVERTLRTLL